MSAASVDLAVAEAAEQPLAPAAKTKRPGAIVTLRQLAHRAKVPVNSFVHLTSRCNLPCMHCYQVRDGTNGGHQVGYGPDMDTPTVMRTLDQLAQMGSLMVTLTGGEALLRRDFDRIVAYARRLGFIVRLFTNGVLVDDVMADRIQKAAPHEVHISVYGVTAETHETVTCAPGSFVKTRRAVEILRARGLPVKVKCVVMTVNFHEWRALRAWADSLGCTYAFDATLTAREDGDTFPKQLRISDEQLREINAELAADDIDRQARSWYDWLDRSEAEQTEFASESVCGACSTTVAIVGDGRVRSCQLMHVDAGSVTEQPLPEIWEGSAWFHKVRSVTLTALRECRTCPDLPFCERCGAMALQEDGDLLGPSAESCRKAAARRAVWESLHPAKARERLTVGTDGRMSRSEREGVDR
ncbi:MAG TPA: radical SAM protein [Myxococcota bacterium]|jgi:radical SAM protein with 4Fe4S-binding SPASM domain|nr:radical SAM protein [Myxococcota bacterium]